MGRAVLWPQPQPAPYGGLARPADDPNAALDKMRESSRLDDAQRATKYGKQSERANATAIYNNMLNARNQANIEAGRQETARAGLGMQQHGQDMADARDAARFSFDARARGYDFATHERRQGILDRYDAAETPEDRSAIMRQHPEVFGREKPASVRDRYLTLTQKDSLGNKTEVALDPTTGRTVRAAGYAPTYKQFADIIRARPQNKVIQEDLIRQAYQRQFGGNG